jgi:ribosome-binding protein aMBF1 (putative translation factor)
MTKCKVCSKEISKFRGIYTGAIVKYCSYECMYKYHKEKRK